MKCPSNTRRPFFHIYGLWPLLPRASGLWPSAFGLSSYNSCAYYGLEEDLLGRADVVFALGFAVDGRLGFSSLERLG